jgi:tRNA (guanine37-N1)-methyltransferase
MRFTVVTLFPEMFVSVLGASLLGKAIAAGHIAVDFVNPRDFTSDRHRTVDDTPYGGGPGMVMKVEPLVAAIAAATASGPAHRILLSPAGTPLSQERVRALAGLAHIVLVCGRYEGVDERVTALAVDEELSLGDFVLTGGELGAMAIIDAVARHVEGVLGQAASTEEESFSEALLEYPQYTRPAEFGGLSVPEVLLGGNHEHIRDWRRLQSLRRTARRRPDLLARHRFTPRDEVLARSCPELEPGRRCHVILAHHPVLDRDGAVVTTSVTNFDIHDIARSAATYGLTSYSVVTPIAAQRDKVSEIVATWQAQLARDHGPRDPVDHRATALSRISVVPSLDQAMSDIAAAHGGVTPLLVGTSARPPVGRPAIGFAALRSLLARQPERPLALLLGTGWGLADEALSACSHVLAPICGRPAWNHLSVRAAAAILLDRLFGLREA